MFFLRFHWKILESFGNKYTVGFAHRAELKFLSLKNQKKKKIHLKSFIKKNAVKLASLLIKYFKDNAFTILNQIKYNKNLNNTVVRQVNIN